MFVFKKSKRTAANEHIKNFFARKNKNNEQSNVKVVEILRTNHPKEEENLGQLQKEKN